MVEKFSTSIKKAQSFSLSRSSSITESAKSFSHFNVKAHVGVSFAGVDAGVDGGADFGQDWGRDSTNTNGDSTTTSNEVTYTIDKEISVPAFSKVQVMSYANWIENLSIPYKAKVTVTGISINPKQNSTLDSQAIKDALRKIKFDEKLLSETSTSLTFETQGTFTGSFGLNSVFSATLIGTTRNTTSSYNMSINQSSANNSGYIRSFSKWTEIYNYLI